MSDFLSKTGLIDEIWKTIFNWLTVNLSIIKVDLVRDMYEYVKSFNLNHSIGDLLFVFTLLFIKKYMNVCYTYIYFQRLFEMLVYMFENVKFLS